MRSAEAFASVLQAASSTFCSRVFLRRAPGWLAHTKSSKTANAIGSALRSGMVGINNHGIAAPETPFGGTRDSGHGREGGTEGIDAYLSSKFIIQSDI